MGLVDTVREWLAHSKVEGGGLVKDLDFKRHQLVDTSGWPEMLRGALNQKGLFVVQPLPKPTPPPPPPAPKPPPPPAPKPEAKPKEAAKPTRPFQGNPSYQGSPYQGKGKTETEGKGKA